ncbi:MAG: DUF1015 domain-containing protein [Thermoplasmatota archaeon]
MVDIRPFKGIQYDKDKIEDMEKVITQPYDKITDEMRDKYYADSEYNYCRLILPKEENRYEMAATRVQNWLREGVLNKEISPGIYVYYQDFEVLGEEYTRKGFISAVKLHPFEEGIVLPHEQTHKGPKIDRLNMLTATEKNLEAGFMLYTDPDETTIDIFDETAKGDPLYEATDEYGVHNRVWKIEDGGKIKEVEKILSGEQVVIADGHHRYETAVTFRDTLREKNPDWQEDDAFNWRMTFMVPVEDPGLVVLPGHRLLLEHSISQEHLEELEKYFDMEEIDLEKAEDFLDDNKDISSFVIYDGEKAISARMKSRDAVEQFMGDDYSEDYKELDVVVLRDVIFNGIMNTGGLKIDETISYERWSKDAIKRVDEGEAKVAFLVNATKPEQVLNVAKNGERMPQKSTDFYPKADSGFTMMDIEPGERL